MPFRNAAVLAAIVLALPARADLPWETNEAEAIRNAQKQDRPLCFWFCSDIDNRERERGNNVDRDRENIRTALRDPPQSVGDAGCPDLERQHVARQPLRRQCGRRLADPGADLHDQGGLAAEPVGPAEARLVDGLVRDHPALVVSVPGLLLARGEATASPRVREHLAHRATVRGQPVVRAGGPGGHDLILPAARIRTASLRRVVCWVSARIDVASADLEAEARFWSEVAGGEFR